MKGMKIKFHSVCRPYRKRMVMSFGSTLSFLPANLAFLYLGLPAKSIHFPFSLSKQYTLLLVTDPPSSGEADSRGKQHATGTCSRPATAKAKKLRTEKADTGQPWA